MSSSDRQDATSSHQAMHTQAPELTASGPTRRPHKTQWAWALVAVAMIAAFAVATPFVYRSIDHSHAHKEHTEAVAQREKAYEQHQRATKLAAEEVAEALSLERITPADRLADPTLLNALSEASHELRKVATLTVDNNTGAVTPREVPSTEAIAAHTEDTATFQEATALLRNETAELKAQNEAIEPASKKLWQEKVQLVTSMRDQANAFLKAQTGLTEDQVAPFEKALEALVPESLKQHETQLVPLVEQLNTAWQGITSTKTPSWQDINGTWCGGWEDACMQINDLVRPSEYGASTYVFTEMWGQCFSGSVVDEEGEGHAYALYCPAGVPTMSEGLQEYLGTNSNEVFVTNDDESKDRFTTFQAPGTQWYFRG